MKIPPHVERYGWFRWVGIQPIVLPTVHNADSNTVTIPLSYQCSTARTRRGALRGLKNHPITPVAPEAIAS